MLCQFKDILGKVGEGVHSYRIFNLAIIDIIFTVITAYFISSIIPKFEFIYVLIILFVLGIVFHRIFCVKTTVDKFLFE